MSNTMHLLINNNYIMIDFDRGEVGFPKTVNPKMIGVISKYLVDEGFMDKLWLQNMKQVK